MHGPTPIRVWPPRGVSDLLMHSQQYGSRRASRRHSIRARCREQTGGEGVRGGSAVGQPTLLIFASYRRSFDVYSGRICTAYAKSN